MILPILAIITLLIYLYAKNCLHLLKLILWASKLPGPLSLPILGCAYRFICPREEILNQIRAILDEYPQPLIKIWLGPKLIVMIRDPVHLEKILQSTKLIEKDQLMDVAKPFIGEGLITGSGPKWKAHRKIIMPTLATKAVESHCSIFEQQATILTEKLSDVIKKNGNGAEVKLEDYLHPCCIDIVGETVMDTKLNTQASMSHDFMEAIYMMYYVIIERIVKPWLQPNFLFQFSHLSNVQTKALKILRTFISEVIQTKKDDKQVEIMENIVDPKPTNGDVKDKKIKTSIEALVNAIYDNTLEITEKELIDEMLTLFMASSDTIASITCFCLKMLAMHPKYQERVVEEFNEVLDKNRQPLNSSTCAKLTFLDQCIRETIRLFPIAPFIVRINRENFELDQNVTIPEGVTVMMALFDVHRNHKYWKNPEQFYPDHFLPEAVESRPQYAYLPFSSGLRACVGKLYAIVSVKILVVKVLQSLRLGCRPDQLSVKYLRLTTDISVRARDGNNVSLYAKT